LLLALNANAQYEKRTNPAIYAQPVMKAIAYGITAPNAHNTQMWFVDTLSATEMLLFVNHCLPETDPPARQQIISAGCFIELVAVGMSNEGYETKVEYLPYGDYAVEKNKLGVKPVAKITLLKNAGIKKDDLFSFIDQRQSNRRPYEGEMITDGEFDEIKKLMGPTHSEMIFINESEKMKPYLDIFYKAMEIETRNVATNEETRKNFRFSEAEREQKKDGLSLPQSGVDGFILKMAEKSYKDGDSATWQSEKMIKATMKNIGESVYSAKGLIFFKTSTNTKLDWLETGRDFARYNLAIVKLGLATSHYNQVIQEYPEMKDLQKEFDTFTNTKNEEKIQVIVRIGRAKPAYKSWRRNAEDFIMK
jgi:hypothetical protein